MTLAEAVRAKLDERRPIYSREILVVNEAGWTAELTLDSLESLGARCWEVTLSRTTPVDNVSLDQQANRIASRVTGLLEPLRVVEIDQSRQLAQLRSISPASKGETLYYYEIERHVSGRSLVRRYQASTVSTRREQIDFTLTHEALAKLIEDLTVE